MLNKNVFVKLFGIVLLSACASGIFALDGEIVSTLGKVEIKDGDSWKALAVGDVVRKGDTISTGFKSQASLKVGNSTFTVQPLSRITIEQLLESDGNQASQMFLDTGTIRADVKAAENKRVGFTVRSPVATASVRGTSGDVSANGRVRSTESVWAVWPTPPGEQNSSVGESDAPSDGGDILGSISAEPPEGVKSTPVSAGNTASVSQNGDVKPPSETAAKNAVSVGGSTSSQSSAESVSSTPANASTVSDNSKPKSTTGSISVSITITE